MSAVAKVKPATVLETARALAAKIDSGSEPDYKGLAEQLLKLAENDDVLLWDLAGYGADALSNAVQAEQRSRRTEFARVAARAAAIERTTPKTSAGRIAKENKRRQAAAALQRITFNWLTSYAIAGTEG